MNINKELMLTIIIISAVAFGIGFKYPVNNPTIITQNQDIKKQIIKSSVAEKPVKIETTVEFPANDEPEEDIEIPEVVPEVIPEAFGFIDINSNVFNQPILAGYYLNNRVNAQRAAELINGTIILPGEMFSFNNVVGSRTVSRGFIESRIIIGNRYAKGVGGGVCRTSTALYQAAKQAGLQINEVHRHSLPVGYAYRGQDAAVWFNTMDLKITNTREDPVKILTITADEKLYIAIVEDVISEKNEEYCIESESDDEKDILETNVSEEDNDTDMPEMQNPEENNNIDISETRNDNNPL